MGNLTIPSKDINNTLSKAYQTLSRYDSFDYKSAVAAQPALYLLNGLLGFSVKAATVAAGDITLDRERKQSLMENICMVQFRLLMAH